MTAPTAVDALPAGLADRVRTRLDAWRAQDGSRRLWAGDASLWTGADEGSWTGWLALGSRPHRPAGLEELVAGVRREGLEHVLLLGMGGSSLCPFVLDATFGRQAGWPRLHVLDSTDPSQIRSAEARLDLARTLVVTASKSGSTLEPSILMAHFRGRLAEVVGAEQAGSRCVAITDPGSKLEAEARPGGFRAVIHGIPSVGGRFSALSPFGTVPAALMGIDLAPLEQRWQAMASACGPDVEPERNPGVLLGSIIGEAALAGKDKLTLVVSPGLAAFGAWLEQLVAESTGKRGRAIIPIDGETLTGPDGYGADRLFVYIRLEAAADAEQDRAVETLERAGAAVVRLPVRDTWELGAEFFRWEVATAVAGHVLGINPFDQPDVEASKVETRRLTDEVERTGALPAEEPFFEGGGIRLFADPANVEALETFTTARSLAGYIGALASRAGPGDYFALLAYLEMNADHAAVLQRLRQRVRSARGVATTLGFGPRFLHSTGQAHKGGPASGVFLQVTCEEAQDLPVPGRRYSFGTVKAAQARGDLAVLSQRGRRALRVHLGADVAAGLLALDAAAARALH